MSGYEDNAFERALRKELLPRRQGRGRTSFAENTWAMPAELGPEWSYGADHTGLLLGYRHKRADRLER